MKNQKYFHELSQEEVEVLISDRNNWSYIVQKYKQPSWCNYPNALQGKLGCWSLVDMTKGGERSKISKSFCSCCDCFKEV